MSVPLHPPGSAPFQVFVKDDDGEIPRDASAGHWTPQGSALLVPVKATGKPSYAGHLALPGGPRLLFRAQPSRRGEGPQYDHLPDFNLFITDDHGNIHKPDGRTWRSFDGERLCDPGPLWKTVTRDGRKHYLKGFFYYNGKKRYIQLWFDFRAKQQRAAEAATLPLGGAP